MVKILSLFLFSLSFLFGITLQEAENLALKNFFDIKKAKKEIDKSRMEVYKAFGEFLPKINLSYSYFFAKKQDLTITTPLFSTDFTFVNDNFYRINLLITQDILNPLALAKIRIARAQKELNQIELKVVENHLRFEVRKAYINALKLKAIIKVLEKQVKRLEEHYKNVKALYDEGYVALKDLLETKVRLYEVKNKLSQAEANYRKSLDFLSFLVRRGITDVEEPQDFPLPRSRNFLQNPELKALKKAIELSQLHINAVTASFYPLVDFTILYQRTNDAPFLPKDRYYVSLNLKWNIFNGGKKGFELRKAYRDVEIARLEYLKKKELLKTKLKGILRDIKTLQEEIKTAELRLREALEHYRLAVEKYKNGLGTNAEVLDAEAYLTSAEQELRIKKYELLLAKFRLLQVLGK